MSSPCIKRAYQPSIITYLHHSNFDSDHDIHPHQHQHESHPRASQTHTPPPSIQSSLLNVGMRIRKAVPSGYRNIPFSSSSMPKYKDSVETSSAPLAETSYNSVARPKELEPLCGIHKVGDMEYVNVGDDDDTRAGVCCLDMLAEQGKGQENIVASVSSVQMPVRLAPSSTHTRKRLYDSESDANTDSVRYHKGEWHMLERPRLRPVTRVRRHENAYGGAASAFDIAMDVDVDVDAHEHGHGDDDFEEAPFLRLPP